MKKSRLSLNFMITNKTAIVFKNKNITKLPIVLHNVNHFTLWIPGTKSLKPPNKIQLNYIIIEHTIPMTEVIFNIQKHNNDKLNLNNTLNTDFSNNFDITHKIYFSEH